MTGQPRAALVFSTWFGCGYFPFGPGTVGSLGAVLLAAAAHLYLGAGRPAILIAIGLCLWPAVWSATATERILKREDPSIVVIDEVLGLWTALLGASELNWKSMSAAFVLFRIFDIWKPWPIKKLEELPEGTGIVADDLAAGAYAAIMLYMGGFLKLY